jgi:hypothetical protein
MRLTSFELGTPFRSGSARWALVYATEEAPLQAALREIAPAVDGNVFGCTSFRGVFTPRGFERGVHVLTGEVADVNASAVVRASTGSRAREDARAAATEMTRKLGRKPDVVLLHATPGFEERVLAGIDDALDRSVPVYGGSAADDELAGNWRVFAGTQIEREGFVIAGFTSAHAIHGSFIAGYTPTGQKGRVTSAAGRVVKTIDGKPAAQVYDHWTNGKIRDALVNGGVVLAQTSLDPIGRLVDRVGQVPRYLLSHPHQVHPDGSLSFFTEMAVGDELVLMLGSEASLLDRTRQVAARARGSATEPLAGGILVYCSGCVGAIGDGPAAEVARIFGAQLGRAPFIGAATFGEQGCFSGPTSVNRHGNLMCDAILFDR